MKGAPQGPSHPCLPAQGFSLKSHKEILLLCLEQSYVLVGVSHKQAQGYWGESRPQSHAPCLQRASPPGLC